MASPRHERAEAQRREKRDAKRKARRVALKKTDRARPQVEVLDPQGRV